MTAHFTQEAEKVIRDKEVVRDRFNRIWQELCILEKEVPKLIPKAPAIIDAIQLASTHMMNASIEIDEEIYENLPGQSRIEEATLSQLLDVLTMIKAYDPRNEKETKQAISYSAALIARSYGIEKNTIYDIWVRRLNLPGQTSGFNELVSEWLKGQPNRLCQVIKVHVQEALHSIVDDFFRS
jgi:hypothetical protein